MYTTEDDLHLTRSQKKLKDFNYEEKEDVEGCADRWFTSMASLLKLENFEIRGDMDQEILMSPSIYKRYMANWVMQAADLVRRQSSQMSAMMEIVECLKTEALADKEKIVRLQDQLLVQKDEQLQLFKTSVEETVQTTVETGIKSYSAAVQKNSTNGAVCNSKILKNVIKSVAAEEDRSKNLIVFGLKEEDGEQLPALVTAVLEEIGEKPHFEATRVGWKRPGITTIRPVKITVPSSTAVHQILMKTGRLRMADAHKDVWICPDRSSEERAARKNVVTDLKKKRAEQTHLDHYIRNGKVCSRVKKAP